MKLRDLFIGQTGRLEMTTSNAVTSLRKQTVESRPITLYVRSKQKVANANSVNQKGIIFLRTLSIA